MDESWREPGTQPNVIEENSSSEQNATCSENSPAIAELDSDLQNGEMDSRMQVAVTVQPANDIIWRNFNISWDSFSPLVLKSLNEGSKDRDDVTQLVHFIVRCMRQIQTKINLEAFRYIAEKNVQKFTALMDVDDKGQVLEKGTHTLTKKLADHNNYLNKSHRRVSASDTTVLPTKRVKKSVKAGCINWEVPGSKDIMITEKDKLNDLLTQTLLQL